MTNPKGRTAVANVPVTVGNTAPTVTIEFPPDGGFFDWGDQVSYTVKVTDPEDGTIDCDRVQLQVLLGHDEHAHPLEQHTGCTGTVQTSLAVRPRRRGATSSRSSRPPTPTTAVPAAPAR